MFCLHNNWLKIMMLYYLFIKIYVLKEKNCNLFLEIGSILPYFNWPRAANWRGWRTSGGSTSAATRPRYLKTTRINTFLKSSYVEQNIFRLYKWRPARREGFGVIDVLSSSKRTALVYPIANSARNAITV